MLSTPLFTASIPSPLSVQITANEIFENQEIRIDLVSNFLELGPTPNNEFDLELGSNRMIDYPEPHEALVTTLGLSVALELEFDPSAASDPLVVDAWIADASQQEGEIWIGQPYVADPFSGQANILLRSQGPISPLPGDYIVPTTTDRDGYTREFSPAVPVPEPGFLGLSATGVLIDEGISASHSLRDDPSDPSDPQQAVAVPAPMSIALEPAALMQLVAGVLAIAATERRRRRRLH